jgi:uncharacterized protein (TIGR03437 family)
MILLRFALGLVFTGASLAQQYTISTFAGGAPPSTPVAASGAAIGLPLRTAIDGGGNLYFSSSNSVFRMDTTGVLTLIAGTSRAGYAGDGGPATAAELNVPQGVAVDKSGNVYIADSANNVIRMVTPDGTISTVAGNGIGGYSGDGYPAVYAQIHTPTGMAVDGSGNIYVAESGSSVIRKFTVGGNISTPAGSSAIGYWGDGGSAKIAQFINPQDVAVDSSGNLFIADTGNAVIRKVDTKGNISTVAGSNVVGYTGDGGAATSAEINAPRGVAVDSSGNIYIAEFGDSVIRKVTAKGTISTIAGTGVYGFAGDGGPAAKAQLANPWSVAVDGSGNVYIPDQLNARVRKIDSSGNINTIAGNGLLSYSGDNGQASRAQLYGPQATATDPSGNVYIADTQNNRVRKVSPAGVITAFAGSGTAGFAGDGGAAVSAQLARPAGVAADSAGNVYISDSANGAVRKVTPDGIINTIAQLIRPQGMAVDAAGNLYVADSADSRIRKISAAGVLSTIGGTGQPGYSGDGGPAVAAQVNSPFGVGVDAVGNVYVADTGNNLLREITPDGAVKTVAGTGVAGHLGDGGPALSAQLAAPISVVVDGGGNIYFADSGSRVRKIAPDGTIATILGGNAPGYSGDNGPAGNAQINSPSGLALDSAGDLYVADTGNNAVRILAPAGFGLTISRVANSASNLSGSIAPGEIVVLYGSGLGPAQTASYQASAGFVPTSLAGTRILFNGIPAPILYTSASQVSAVVPFATPVGPKVQILAQYQTQTSAPVSSPVAAAAPALFTADSSGTGQAQASNQDGSTNSAVTPAKVGSVLSLFGTGGGPTSPKEADGLLVAAQDGLTLPVIVTIGGQPASVQYAGSSPGSVAGTVRIDVQIPDGVAGSALPVVVQVGGVSSQAGVTVAVSGS